MRGNQYDGVFTSVYTQLKSAEHTLNLHILINECACACQWFLAEKGTIYKQVKVYNTKVDCINSADKIAKYHSIVHIITMDHTYTTQLWSRIIQLTEDTLNMLQTAPNLLQ